MTWWQAVLLGIVEGVTEFLPVSSTGHLTIAEGLLGLPVDDPGVTAFTALIQVGAIGAVLVYFFTDIRTLAVAWTRGLVIPAERRRSEYRMAWHVIAGSVPIGLVGFLAKDVVAGQLRSLWVVAGGLVAWSLVMYLAECSSSRRVHSGHEDSVRGLTFRDSLVIGIVQCAALVPGVSRSGATISAGLFRGLDRVTATRVSFLLSVPALVAAGVYEGATTASQISATHTFTADAPNAVWLTDISEHPTGDGKIYLCAVRDLHSNKIVGYSLDSRMKSSLAVAALRNAVALRSPVTTIVHSDRGSQFRFRKYVKRP